MTPKTSSGQRTKRTPRKLDRAKVRELAEQGLKTVDIAKHQGVARSTVFRFLQQTEPDRQALEAFKKDRGDVFARLSMKRLEVQEKIVDTFDERLIATLQPHQKGSLLHALNIQAGTLYDKERLERGQSTANLSVLAKLITAAEDKLGVSKTTQATTERTSREMAKDADEQGNVT
jgi:IS30 family transposase